MLLDQKPLIYIWRPFHRVVFKQAIWPFLERIKVFFFAESRAQFHHMADRLDSLERLSADSATQLHHIVNRLKSLEHVVSVDSAAQAQSILNHLAQIERTTAAGLEQHASAFEQLYLCILSDPDRAASSQLEQLLEAERRNQSMRDCELTRRLDDLEAETRRRWESIEQLFTAFLSDRRLPSEGLPVRPTDAGARRP